MRVVWDPAHPGRLDNQSLRVRYIWRDGENDSNDPRYDGEIPYIPDQYFEAGSQWSLPGNILLGADAVYRSRRFEVNPNLPPAQSGWAIKLTLKPTFGSTETTMPRRRRL